MIFTKIFNVDIIAFLTALTCNYLVHAPPPILQLSHFDIYYKENKEKEKEKDEYGTEYENENYDENDNNRIR